MQQPYSLGSLGYVVPGTLQEVGDGEYELIVSFKNRVGKVFYDEETHTVNYGIFMNDFFKLNSNMRAAVDQKIWHYIRNFRNSF
jgi:hypothetical protein